MSSHIHRWDDNRLRSYLEERGVIKTKSQATRDELLGKMRDAYAKTTNPIWQAWSDSYIVSKTVPKWFIEYQHSYRGNGLSLTVFFGLTLRRPAMS